MRPATINKPVTVGQTITVHAEIVNWFDQRIPAASVPVNLGQVIHEQVGTINSAPPIPAATHRSSP